MDSKTLKALLNKQKLSSADKSKITKAYQLQFNRKPVIKNGCDNCYHDALTEIYAHISKSKRLCAGVVIEYKGRFYNRHDYPLPEWILQNHQDKIEKI